MQIGRPSAHSGRLEGWGAPWPRAPSRPARPSRSGAVGIREEACPMAETLLRDEERTREQLLEEVRALRRRLHALENGGARAAPPVAPGGFLALPLDHSPAPIYVTSADGRYLLVNRAWEELFRRRRADVLGRPADEVIP